MLCHSLIHSFISLFVLQIFIKHLPTARHRAKWKGTKTTKSLSWTMKSQQASESEVPLCAQQIMLYKCLENLIELNRTEIWRLFGKVFQVCGLREHFICSSPSEEIFQIFWSVDDELFVGSFVVAALWHRVGSRNEFNSNLLIDFSLRNILMLTHKT